jgi:hypothetical protein
MIETPAFAPVETGHELRFVGLFNRGAGFAFPCDSQGHVDIDSLTDRGRANYFYARAVVGSTLAVPIVSPVRPTDARQPFSATGLPSPMLMGQVASVDPALAI